MEYTYPKFDEYVFFWRTKDVFSQWHPSNFADYDTGYVFNCAEQWMMFHKAVYMKDEDTALMILKNKNPKTIKELGRNVKNFDAGLWDEMKEMVVYRGNKLKFEQNIYLFHELTKTKGKELIEASPFDKIWGIGFDEENALKIDKNLWGENLLGKILTQLRYDIIEE